MVAEATTPVVASASRVARFEHRREGNVDLVTIALIGGKTFHIAIADDPAAGVSADGDHAR